MLLRLSLLTLFCYVTVVNANINQLPGRHKEVDGAIEVEMTAEHGLEMYDKWMKQAFSSLMSAIASKNMKRLSDTHQVELEECSKTADTVIKHSKCITKMFKHRKTTKKTRLSVLKNDSRIVTVPEKTDGNWVGGIRIKRENKVVSSDGYRLLQKDEGMSAFGAVAKVLHRTVAEQKNHDPEAQWQNAVEKVRSSAKRRKDARKAFAEKQATSEFEGIEQLAFKGLGDKHKEAADLEDIIDKPDEMKKLIQDKKYKMSQDPVGRLTNLLRDGVKLGFQLAGENVTDFDDKNLQLISPRFFSVTPQQKDNDTVNVLSPSLLSLHNEGTGAENLTSLPNLVKGFNGKDQQEWLNFIIEAAGVADEAEKLDHETEQINKIKSVDDYEKEIRGENGQPLYFTKQNVTDRYGDYEKRKIEVWEHLAKSYSKHQLKDLNNTGYALLNKEQLQVLYGSDSPFNHTESLDKFSNLNQSDIHGHIEENIKLISKMDNFDMRQKDIALSPVFFSPLILATPALNTLIVLSPIVFSPIILSPAVLGPIILSPWVFVPLILSPRVLAPLILSPMIFSPLILSPLVLHPLILTPGIFNPLILTPLVLSPLILSPQVFTPIILSPLVLNPLILNPMVGSPLILSPFVLSPLVFSPQALFALVLSPYAVSPLIESKLIVSALVLSPSWLS